MFAFVFILTEEKRRVKDGARQNRKNKIRYLFYYMQRKKRCQAKAAKND